jgi:L-asparagine transporter-like permease
MFGGLIMDYEEEDFLFTVIAVLVIVAIIILSVVAFAPKQISEEKIEVEAIITEVDRDPARLVGKVCRPADYDIYFEYQGIKGEWDVSHSTYNEYKDKIGQPIKCY